MDIFLLIIGIAGLWLGTELTIRGATSIASRLGMSDFVVGVAILSVGSDLPELTISIDAAIRDLLLGGSSSDVVIGSALGSTLCQFGFVLGLVGLMRYLTLPKQIVYRHGSILVGTLVILALVAIDGTVSRSEGATLITIYIIYFIFLLTEKLKVAAPNTVMYCLQDLVLGFICWSVLLLLSAVLNSLSSQQSTWPKQWQLANRSSQSSLSVSERVCQSYRYPLRLQ